MNNENQDQESFQATTVETAKKKTSIDIEMEDGTVYVFDVTRKGYIEFVNETMGPKKYAAQFNLLTGSVRKDQQVMLGAMLAENPQAVPDMCSVILEEYKPGIAGTVKKRNAMRVD